MFGLGYFYGIDMTYIVFVLPFVILSLVAQFNVTGTFKKYSSVASARRITGAEAAKRILERNGIYNVRVEAVKGNLTDHYDPKAGVIRLSESVYGSTSIAAIGVASHEAGHAVQHAVGYSPIKIRMAIIPICNIGSTLAVPLVLLGILFSSPSIAYLGVIAFAAAVLFQLVTLPVEFNASRRAIGAIEESYTLDADEIKGAKKVLTAAALTYVAALAVSLGNLLRLLVIAGRTRRR